MTIKELKAKSIWLNWDYKISTNGIKTKVPYSPLGGISGTNDKYQDTWTNYEFAKEKNSKIGLVFRDGICGIDIDNGANKKQINKIIELMDTYTEKSPSGNGFHILFTCDISKLPVSLVNNYYQKNPYNHLECYISNITNRYFTFTNDVIRDLPINDRTDELILFLNTYMIKSDDKTLNTILKSKTGDKFKILYYLGDISDYNYDDSSADMALCNILAFYTQGDFNKIDDYFSKSALYRDKWDRSDYKNRTINKAIIQCGNGFYNRPGRPKKNISLERKKEEFTMEILINHLEKKNISIKYNEIKKEVEIIGYNKRHSKEHIGENFSTIIFDELKTQFTRCDLNIINKYLEVIATDNKYNPIIEKLETTELQDNKDYFDELTKILEINDDYFSCLLLKKWLWQCCSICQNTIDRPFGADGILVLCGPQGYGKTRLIELLGFNGEYASTGKHINDYDKDTFRRCCSNWIVELAELESTLRSDIEKLKAFITDKVDEYRLPYGRKDIKLARKTSLVGTCNNTEYLVDQTGNRRFWTIPISKRIDTDKLYNFNFVGLWSQIYNLSKHDLQGFRLTPEEQETLNNRNCGYEKNIPAEYEIKDILSNSDARVIYKEITVTFFKQNHECLKNYTVQQISKVLNKLKIEQKIKNNQRLRLLPVMKI